MSIDFDFQQIGKMIGQVFDNDLPQIAAKVATNVEFLGSVISDVTQQATPALVEGIGKIQALWDSEMVQNVKNCVMLAVSSFSTLFESPLVQEFHTAANSFIGSFDAFVGTCVYSILGNPVRL